MTTDEWLQKVFDQADDHAEGNSDFDYAIGDLQALFAAAFRQLTPRQRVAFACDDAVMDVFDSFDDHELLDEIVN